MLEQILHIGLSNSLSKAQQLQIRIRNGVATATIATVILYTLIYLLAVGINKVLLLSHIPYLVVASSIFVVHYFRQAHLVEPMVNILYPVCFAISCIILGKEYHLEYFLFMTGINALFSNKKYRIYYLIWSMGLFIGLKIYHYYYPEPIIELHGTIRLYINIINGITPFIIIYILMFVVLRYNKRLNKKLEEISINQESIILQRTQELQEKSNALIRSNEELKKFSYISAHDLREPLRGILSFSQLLERRLQSNTDDKIIEYLHYIQLNTKRIDSITKDIVNYTEIEEQVEDLELVNTAIIVQDISDSFQQKKNNIVFEIHALPTIEMNMKLCHTLFFNLIQNAIQYNDKSVTTIKIAVTSKANEYLFQITDNGMGIAPEYHEKIFMMFKRLHNDLSKSGSGIGLAICKKIVEAHHGKIWVDSITNIGSTFSFTLPRISK